MKTIVGSVALLVLLTGSGIGARQYTLDELLAVGIENSRAIRSVNQELIKAQSQINLAIGSALPTVDAKGSYGYAASTVVPATGTIVQPNEVGGSLTGHQPLYSQGKTLIGLRMAKLSSQTLLCKYNDERSQARATITGLFYKAINTRKNSDVLGQALDIARETHRLAKARFMVGSSGEFDTIQSGMNLALAQFDLQKAQSDLRMAYRTLLTECVLDQNVDSFSIVGEIPESTFDLPLDKVLDRVQKENRTITQLRGNEQIQKEQVRLASSDFLPSAGATASVGRTAAFDALDKMNKNLVWIGNTAVGVDVTFNLFNGLQTWQRLKQAQADLAIFILAEQQTVDDIMLQTKGSYDTLQNARTQLSVVTDVIKLAQKAYDISKVAYEVGTKTILDLQNAELALNQARITYNAAQLSYINSLISLRVLMGDY